MIINLNNKTKIDRPDKASHFLYLAFVCAQQSCDAQSKCGTVITDKNNRILGTGYNSFPRDIDNTSLPNLRPDKYPFMFHGEMNAIFNCRLLPKYIEGGGTAYVTGICCSNCLMALWQAGVNEIYQTDRRVKMVTEEHDTINQIFLDRVPMQIHVIKPDFSFVEKISFE